MSNTGNSNVIAVQGGLLPLLVSIAVYLYPSHSASAEPETTAPDENNPAEKLQTIIDRPDVMNLSLISIQGHIDRYVDQYLFESDEPDSWYAEETASRDGRRLIGAEFIYYQNTSNIIGDRTELGLRSSLRQETRNFGDLDAELILSDMDVDYINRQKSSSDIECKPAQLPNPKSPYIAFVNLEYDAIRIEWCDLE